MFAVFFVWFASVVPYISAVFFGIAAVLLGFLLIWFLGVAIHNDSYREQKKYPLTNGTSGGKWLMGLGIASALFWAMLPSEKTVYMMGGAYVGQSVIQSETAGKVKKLLDSKLDKYVEELEGKAKTEVKKNLPAVDAAVEAATKKESE